MWRCPVCYLGLVIRSIKDHKWYIQHIEGHDGMNHDMEPIVSPYNLLEHEVAVDPAEDPGQQQQLEPEDLSFTNTATATVTDNIPGKKMFFIFL